MAATKQAVRAARPVRSTPRRRLLPTSPDSLFPLLGPATSSALFHGLEGAPAAPTDPATWAQESAIIAGVRLSGLALQALDSAGVHPDPEVRSGLEWARDADSARSLALEAAALPATVALARADIPSVIIKGPGIAARYPHASLRPFTDIDVLVPPRRFTQAARILAGMGFAQPSHTRPPRPYYNRWCREGINLLRADGASVDLHHRIPPWVWGRRLRFRDVLERSQVAEVPGGSVRFASDLHNLMIVALHVISDRGRPGRTLLVWRDLVAMCAACGPEDAAAMARQLGLSWLLSLTLRALPPNLRPKELLELLTDDIPGAVDRFRLRGLLPPAIGSRHQLALVFRLPVPSAMAFLAGYVAPSPSFLRDRYRARWAYTRWWGDALGRLRDARRDS